MNSLKMQTVLIRVTQDDIDKGCAFKPGNCPIARAFQRRLRHRYSVAALHSGIRVYVNSCQLGVIETPNVASDFMVDFDTKNKPVKPVDLKFDVPLALYFAAFKQ